MPTLAQPDYTFDEAIRKRFETVQGIGQQQNTYVNNQAAIKQQQALQARQQALLAAQQQGMQSAQGQQSFDAGSVPTTGGGKMASNPNPRSVEQALAFAKQAAASGDSSWYRMCLAFVARAYGIASGSPTAIAAYQLAAKQGRITNNMTPNVGSVVYWNTGGGRPGHAALYAGNGMIYSNDIGGRGRISLVPIGDISKKWGSQYLGWSDPYFAASPRR